MTNFQTIGRYEIIQELGRGGFGVVYLAKDTQSGQLVALKLLHPHLNHDPAFVSRFEREAEAIIELKHSSIVKIYNIEAINSQLAIVMDYLPGQTLRNLIQAKGLFSLEQAVSILSQMAEALDYIHSEGIIHRDIKSANIMVTEAEEGQRVILFDLGLTKALSDYSSLTASATIPGTPEYMAPEQADPNRADEVGPATDRYALGIIAYEMLTGRVPFQGNTVSILYAHEHKTPPPPRQLQPKLPEAVEAALLKMLAKAPADRYETATAFADVLIAEVLIAEARPQPLRIQWNKSFPSWADGIEMLEKLNRSNNKQILRVDAAVPDKVTLGLAFSLAVAVRLASSPILAEDDLQIVKSGNVGVQWRLWFRSYIYLKIQIDAPDCEVYGSASHTFRLYREQDSPVFYFHLTPRKQGAINIIVKVYQKDDWLGGTRIHTLAYEQAVGSVQLQTKSHLLYDEDNDFSPMFQKPAVSGASLKTRSGLNSLIANHNRRLQKLKEQKALEGISVDPKILIEIEDIEAQIKGLEEKLETLGNRKQRVNSSKS